MQATDPNTPPLKFRKLRIAWSVACGLLAVLLCVLWVRSYWVIDSIGRIYPTPPDSTSVILFSQQGTLLFGRRRIPKEQNTPQPTHPWTYSTFKQKDNIRNSLWWHSAKNEFAFRFPAWLPLPFIALIAWVPWLNLRFSLRTL